MNKQQAIFSAGCFWGVEEKFRKVDGVLETEVGYTGGEAENPTYHEVCGGGTGHIESIKITFDADVVSYGELIDFFFEIHDPTTINQQGPDIGTQYKSAIFYSNEEQKSEAEKKIKEKTHLFPSPIVTAVEKEQTFYKAEEYHQKYLQKLKER